MCPTLRAEKTTLRWRLQSLAAATILFLAVTGLARAEPIKISAFGDSSLYGGGEAYRTGRFSGVPVAEAFPAKLERALRARGWDVAVSNNAVPGRRAGAGLGAIFQIPVGTKLTIVRFGGLDLRLDKAGPEQVASYLSQVIDAVHQKGSAVILVKEWFGRQPVLDAIGNKADFYAAWWVGLNIADRVPRPEYDAGDGEHLNAAGTDIVVARAVPDVERVLTAFGLKPGS
jgi:acyl-CoA thioesterase-1